MKKKVFAFTVALAMLTGTMFGKTLAYLTDATEQVENTFTVGNVDIALEETTKDFKMVPGNKIAKDPKVTVKAGSEDCWLFVKVEKTDNLDNFIIYEKAEGWEELPGETGIFYRMVSMSDEDQMIEVLRDNQVWVKEDITKVQMDAVADGTEESPALTFTAYAVQKANVGSAAEAWTVLDSSSVLTIPDISEAGQQYTRLSKCA